ncbi:hypothetical protein [Hydrogenophaga sp. BPS33]|uniref:hypothetical protein n=1 Tax=Hydrogenophaga sp. BPS33 TaxID=2651974 RepID=UPI00131F63EF|nr:hypothetical protein [Hydrogenophaga sp. BPS33]QHE89231.1 hypothetical protein F9K07_30055 [Hydrogenophaga sp. BPS33]
MRIEGGPLEILPITEEDLLYHPATEDICDAFTRGEFPLERLATSRYFTYMHEGDEVIVDASIINAIESDLQDDLVIVEGEFNQVMIPASSVKTGVSQDEWIAAVEAGKTQADFSDWRALMVSQLPRARDIFKRNGTQA